MDSTTHALYKAVVAENVRQQEPEQQKVAAPVAAAVPGDHGRGLQPLASRPSYLNAYQSRGFKGTDLHITLTGRTDEVLALYLEMTGAGLAPPAGMVEDGAEVFLGQGLVMVCADAEDARGLWSGKLVLGAEGRRAEWREAV